MSREKERIQTMVQEGKITPKQGDDLLLAMEQSNFKNPWNMHRFFLNDWQTLCVLVLALLLFFFGRKQPHQPAETFSNTLGIREVPANHRAQEGELLFWNGQTKQLLPLISTAATAQMDDTTLRVHLVQTFVNPTSKDIHAVYTFPTPGKSFIDTISMMVNQKAYPVIFNDPLPIPPGAKVTVTLSVMRWLTKEQERHQFRFPMTSASPLPIRDESNIALSLHIKKTKPLQAVQSFYHGITYTTTPQGTTLTLQKADTLLNKDFLVTF